MLNYLYRKCILFLQVGQFTDIIRYFFLIIPFKMKYRKYMELIPHAKTLSWKLSAGTFNIGFKEISEQEMGAVDRLKTQNNLIREIDTINTIRRPEKPREITSFFLISRRQVLAELCNIFFVQLKQRLIT